MCVCLLAMLKRKGLVRFKFHVESSQMCGGKDPPKEAAACEFKVDPHRICEWCPDEKLVDLKKQGSKLAPYNTPSRSVIAHLPLT